MDPAKPAYFELNFRPNIELISVVRRFVADFYEQILGSPDATSRLALATHELLENAVKYSTNGQTTIQIQADRTGPRRKVRISTTNQADAAHVAALRAQFAEMQACGDADAYYQTLMLRTAKRKDGSGLGIARIMVEGEMTMHCELGDDTVRIMAETEIREEAA